MEIDFEELNVEIDKIKDYSTLLRRYLNKGYSSKIDYKNKKLTGSVVLINYGQTIIIDEEDSYILKLLSRDFQCNAILKGMKKKRHLRSGIYYVEADYLGKKDLRFQIRRAYQIEDFEKQAISGHIKTATKFNVNFFTPFLAKFPVEIFKKITLWTSALLVVGFALFGLYSLFRIMFGW